jgi:RHS repeat-associated protein
LTQVDPSGRTVVTNTYNDLAKTLLTTIDASGATTRFSYDTGIGSTSTGELKSMTDAVGRRTAYYVHMVFGWRTDEVDPQGVHTRYTHDTVGRVKTQVVTPDATKPNETRTTSYVYDDKGRLTSTTHPDATTTTTTYNAIDKPATECDAINRCTTYTYDNAGNLQSTSYPDGTSESKTYDANGNVETETDRAGRTTRYVYDELDRLKTTILPDGTPNPDDNPFTEQTYDAAGRLYQVSNERGHTTTYGYDDAGRQTSVTNALNQTTTTVYDVAGRRTSVTDALSRTTKFVYDEAGRLIETIAPDETPWTDSDNPRTTSAYDALGRKTRETDGEGRITRYRYGIGGQLDMVVLPNPATGANPELVNGESPANAGTLVTRYEYDTLGHKRRQIDALNRTTSWTYDESGRVLTRTLPLLQQESFVYDTLGRRTQHIDFRGRTTTYAYKPNTDLLQTIDYATDTDTTIAYTAEGQIDTVQDGNGTTSYEYGDRGQLEKVTWPSGLWIEYGYDDAGNRTQLTTADQSIAYTFDELNRLKTVTPTLGQGATYDYDAVGNRATVTHANGVTTTYTYHPGNQLRTLTTTRPGNVQEYVLAYRIDKSGLRTQVAQLQDTFTRATYDYEYDKVKRLTGEYVFLPAGRSRTVNWTYDKVGNRLTEARTGVRIANSAYSYDANDRLTQHTTSGTAPDVGTTTYQYDNAGNLTQKTSPQGTENYVYDDANRMVELIAANQEVTRYAYNHNGIRIKQTRDATGSSPQTAHYLVDPNQAYAQVVEEHAQTGSNPKTLAALYTFGDDRISQYRPANGTTPATVRHYHADGLGSTRLLTDNAGVVTDRYYYEAFGELETAASLIASDNDFLYTGEQLDPNSGFYYLRARYMNPRNGRFTQQDAFEGVQADPASLHKYLYAGGDPIANTDPSGLKTLGQVITAVNVAGNIHTAATISVNILTGNYAVAAGQIAEEVVYAKLGALGRPVAHLSEKAINLFYRIWGRGVKLKLGLASDAKVLEDNLIAVGVTKPAGSIQAHHIVAGNSPHALPARNIFTKYNIDINSPMNGVFLQGCGSSAAIGTIHCGSHLAKYYQEVSTRIVAADLAGGKIEVLNELSEIKIELLTGMLELNSRGIK